ncbi:hypothetical protein BCR33DRAFT_542834 [Rhizoclosmatium globosum]|uniref:C2H2-type domain-containing protein n=1 Tax=Rhizoclosmatium globosum TaxID=329046 RepID=A0A1Y2BAG3_9FUNG|nr:hypothetical protein BCR33DRAFT_542834 [Rhizoclosmatium globosum]|eukprot:ORY31744.1 hypothetical protein BCR33DRAFT_542834 [Rhizoclosmatium globosum]
MSNLSKAFQSQYHWTDTVSRMNQDAGNVLKKDVAKSLTAKPSSPRTRKTFTSRKRRPKRCPEEGCIGIEVTALHSSAALPKSLSSRDINTFVKSRVWKLFTTQFILTRHVSGEHGEEYVDDPEVSVIPSAGPPVCPKEECKGKQFPSQWHLERHLRSHNNNGRATAASNIEPVNVFEERKLRGKPRENIVPKEKEKEKERKKYEKRSSGGVERKPIVIKIPRPNQGSTSCGNEVWLVECTNFQLR